MRFFFCSSFTHVQYDSNTSWTVSDIQDVKHLQGWAKKHELCYNKNHQKMRLFVLCLYFLFLVFSLHVSGLHGPIIRVISSCCFYATICFKQCFVGRLRASADWFVVVPSVYKPVRWRTQTTNKALHEPNGGIKTTEIPLMMGPWRPETCREKTRKRK